MDEVLTADGRIKLVGGWNWVPLLPVAEVTQALGATPSPNTIALASLLIDHLGQMDSGLFSLRGRPFSRSVKAILEYFNPSASELQVLIRLLAHYGYARAFLNLAVPSNDDGLKLYLLDRGVDWEQILFYYEMSLWDPIRFTVGFMLGLGASSAAILEVAKDLFDFGAEALDNPSKAAAKIRKFVEGVRELSLQSLFTIAKETWTQWDKEFSQALFECDFDKAGFMLGKLAGDLWQLFTGIRALAKLPGMTMKLARSFGSLFAKGARFSRSALTLLANLIRRLATMVKEAVQLGYTALVDFFDDLPLLAQRLREGALIIVDDLGRMVVGIPPGGLVLEGVGPLEEGFLFAQGAQGTTSVFARVRVTFEKGLKYAESLGPSVSKKVKDAKISVDFARAIKEAEEVAGQMLKAWRDTLQAIVTDGKIPINPREFGQWIHENLEIAFADITASLKTFTAVAETQIRGLAKTLASNAAELKLFLQRADTPLLTFAKATPGMYEALGVADEKELIKLLKSIGYKNPDLTLIGDLVSDGVLFNRDAKTLLSIDWTSGLGRLRYADQFEKTMRAAGTLSDAQKLELAQTFLRHTLREYALREAILAYIFDGWETKVIEVMYEPLRMVK